MAQYQTFPGAPGDSLTLEKLKNLALPELGGKSFLDVGCNEGFFCGFARFQGAARSVGVDKSVGFISRARERFPDCEFIAEDWDHLPEGPFDVILMASALHYAADQEALLHRLAGMLSQDGVLVLELGIFSSQRSEWVKVQRGMDERVFPTMPKIREILSGYAWKWMGPSVAQAGDPVARHVLHISRRRKTAYLLMQPPAYGKSSIASALFPKAAVPVVSGDVVFGRIASGDLQAPAPLVRCVREHYSPFKMDRVVKRVFDGGLGRALVQVWCAQAGPGDFALDMFVPEAHQAMVRRVLLDNGYLPVALQWDRPGGNLMAPDLLRQRAEEFYLSLASGVRVERPLTPRGFVDEAELAGGELVLRGWAFGPEGNLPGSFTVWIDGVRHVVDRFERQLRPDVQRHLALPHALVGYRLEVPWGEVEQASTLGGRLRVVAGAGDEQMDLQLSGELDRAL